MQEQVTEIAPRRRREDHEPLDAKLRRLKLRTSVRGVYDLQQLRMQQGLRLVANFRSQLKEKKRAASGSVEEALAEPEVQPEDQLSEEAEKLIDQLKASYRRLTDGVARNRRLPKEEGFKGDDLIDDYTGLVLVDQYIALEKEESKQFRQLEGLLAPWPIYQKFLKDVTGIGPAMAGIIMAEIDIHNNVTVSGLWALSGLDVAPDGLGRSRRREHLVKREYRTREGTIGVRDSVTFNPFLKTKLTGVLGPSFLRTASPKYRKIYDDYKHRLTTDPNRIKATPALIRQYKDAGQSWWKELWTKRRIHEASIRYMVKMFLLDLYVIWHEIEGLPVREPYHVAKLGMRHTGTEG